MRMIRPLWALVFLAACGAEGDDESSSAAPVTAPSGSGSSCFDGASSSGGLGFLFGFIYCGAYPGVFPAPLMALPPGALVAFDLVTGERAVVEGDGPPFLHPVAIALDATGETAYVADAGLEAIIAVDLRTGARRIVSDGAHGTGPALSMPTALVLDGGRLVVFRSAGDPTLAVDPLTGDRVPETTRIAVPAEPMQVIDTPRGRVLVVEPIGP